MSLSIGRKGWIGVGLQTGFQVPAAITDYVDFTVNTLTGITEQNKINNATSNRDMIASSVLGKQYSMGDIEIVADSNKAGYFILGALGAVQTVSLGSGVFRHTMTRNNSNTPQYLTITNDRAIDRALYADVTVDQLDIAVGTDLVTAHAKLVGNFPQTTTSGTKTTTSGNVFNFRNAQFAFGTTISGAQAATALKPHDFKMSIMNNAETVFAHSSSTPRSVNVKGFDASVEFTLYFENTIDRDNYYAQNKQAASMQLTGNGIGGGFSESVVFNFYKTSFESLAIETGIDNYYAEKVKLEIEFDAATQRSMDCVITNTKTLYI
jgi:hypothetical protein